MKRKTIHNFTTFFIGCVWLLNGLFAKVLNYVPRHQEIVGTILSQEYAGLLTNMIGISEIAMSLWIFSQIWSKQNAILQIFIILTMNMIEFIMVPHLLFWGKLNIVFAIVFSGLIYYNSFYLKKSLNTNHG